MISPAQEKGRFAAKPLTMSGDLSAIMVEGIDTFLTRETERAAARRNIAPQLDFTDSVSFNRSVAPYREQLARILGVVDKRIIPRPELITGDDLAPVEAVTKECIIRPIRWKVLDYWTAEAIWLQPIQPTRGRLILIPDADQLPEVWAGLQTGEGTGIARQLAAAGFEVIIPALINRSCEYSGNPSLNRFTNQTHREWIYRQAYEVGRHVIGYELQQIFSIIDWFERKDSDSNAKLPVGIAGYGEGGLLALYAAALDPRISTVLTSGYFQSRNRLWEEPIYRNVFGLLNSFGDAELALMTWPRTLLIDASAGPEVDGPPLPSTGRSGASPGKLKWPGKVSVKEEYKRAVAMVSNKKRHLRWYEPAGDDSPPFSKPALTAFIKLVNNTNLPTPPGVLNASRWIDVNERQERLVRGMEDQVQHQLLLAERVRNQEFWAKLKGDTAQQIAAKEEQRERFWNQIGKLPAPSEPLNPRARIYERNAKWTSYEVMLDVWPGVFVWGILVVPNNLKSGERRPVVVCQHGLEGTPYDVVSTEKESQSYAYYKGFGTRLAEQGYITFSPAHLYRGQDKFRVLQRKGNPLGLTLFSVMIGQHQQILNWLKELNFVDPSRIGFYGLSYGGKSAMRIPSVLQDYAFSICSADFNEWVLKCATTKHTFSYLFTGEYDMPEWDLGHTFNYAEMAALIAPRPFMVERGHLDGVATSEWVAYEYAKVQRHYDMLGIGSRTRIEFFPGPHTINGVGTYQFIDQLFKPLINGSK